MAGDSCHNKIVLRIFSRGLSESRLLKFPIHFPVSIYNRLRQIALLCSSLLQGSYRKRSDPSPSLYSDRERLSNSSLTRSPAISESSCPQRVANRPSLPSPPLVKVTRVGRSVSDWQKEQ